MLKVLDLFCGAGGASAGLASLPGADVYGLDIMPQPRYPFRFAQGDALAVRPSFLRRFDLVWASPPCQAWTAYKRRPGHVGPAANLIGRTRELLQASGVPWILENVPGARRELRGPVQLCGSSFGLDVRRHRLFETSRPVQAPACDHGWQTPRFPPAGNRSNLRSTVEVGVWRIPMDVQNRAMGIDWMTREELSQAIPPAYAAHLGRELMKEHGRALRAAD
jgi:DNA (cytosine-5)-methyltransferase 1